MSHFKYWRFRQWILFMKYFRCAKIMRKAPTETPFGNLKIHFLADFFCPICIFRFEHLQRKIAWNEEGPCDYTRSIKRSILMVGVIKPHKRTCKNRFKKSKRRKSIGLIIERRSHVRNAFKIIHHWIIHMKKWAARYEKKVNLIWIGPDIKTAPQWTCIIT